MKNPKAKGNKFEHDWAASFREVDPTSSRNYGSGSGMAKSDTHNSLGYEFECKHVEKLNIWTAIEEAERHANQAHTIPAVVFRRNRMPEPYVAIPAWHFKDLIKKSKEPKTTKTDNQRLQWLIRNAIEALKRLLKELSNG